MKSRLLKKLIKEGKNFYDNYFFESDYRSLSNSTIKELLTINNLKIRMDAIEALTHDIVQSNKGLIPLILNYFKSIKSEIVSSYLMYSICNRQMFNSNKEKYMLLVNTIPYLNDDQVSYICNIFWSNEFLMMTYHDYDLYLKQYILLSGDDLREVENILDNNNAIICNPNNLTLTSK